MEIKSGAGDPEAKFAVGTFGHLVENYDPALFKVLRRKKSVSSEQYSESFGELKDELLSLCTKPEVSISPKQGDVIQRFMGEIYEFKHGEVLIGDEWIKIDNEKLLVLATYINSLH